MISETNKKNLTKRISLFEDSLVDIICNYGFEEQEGFKDFLKKTTGESDVMKYVAVKLFNLIAEDVKLSESERILLKKIKVEMEKSIDMNCVKEKNNLAFDKKTSKSSKTREYYQNYYTKNKDRYEVRRIKKKDVELPESRSE